MAIDVFHEDMLVKAAHLAGIRQAKAAWGRALVRTDIDADATEFLARSFRGCLAQERTAKLEARNAISVVRVLGRR